MVVRRCGFNFLKIFLGGGRAFLFSSCWCGLLAFLLLVGGHASVCLTLCFSKKEHFSGFFISGVGALVLLLVACFFWLFKLMFF